MTHLELENLASDYLEGQLDAVRRVEAEAHLRDCVPCRELIGNVRRALELCRTAEDLEPFPWLVPKILLATVGEKKPTLAERLAALLRPAANQRVAYAVGMAMFSFSIIINAAGINLRRLKLADLNPRTWIYQANRSGQLLAGRVEKYYYNLRMVYEIESRLRELRQQTGQGNGRPGREAPKSDAPPAGTSDSAQPGHPELAEVQGLILASYHFSGALAPLIETTRRPLQ